MTHNGLSGDEDTPRDPLLEAAFAHFVQQAQAPPEFAARVRARVALLHANERPRSWRGAWRRLWLKSWWPALRLHERIPADFQPLISAIAQAILEPLAPEELVLFPDTRDTYFAHPGRLLRRWPRRASPLAFGRSPAPDEIYWTPIVLEVSRALATYVTAQCPRAVLPGALTEPASAVTYVRQALQAAERAETTDASRALVSRTQVYDLVIAQAQQFLPAAQARSLAEHTVRSLFDEAA